MKKIISSVCVIFMLSVLALQANAQKGQWKLNLNYSYSLPLGSFKSDIISTASPRGFSGDIMYGVSNKFSLGLYSGYQDYYQKYPRGVYETGNHEVTSAVLSNSIQTMPLLLKGVFSPLGDGKAPVKPYISAAAGITLINFSQYLGEFGGTTSDAGFSAKGGAGVLIPFGRFTNAGANLGADYNYISYNKYGYSNLNNVSFHAGVYFPLR